MSANDQLPDGWKRSRLDGLIASLDAGVSVNGEDRAAAPNEIGVLKISAVSYGVFDPSAHKAVVPKDLARVQESPRGGHLIVSRANSPELVGASVLVDRDYPSLFLSDKLWQAKPRQDREFDIRWLSEVLATVSMRRRVAALATGTSESMKNVSQDDFLGLEFPVPPVDYQRKIAEVARCFDEHAKTLDALITVKTDLRKGLIQQLLTGRRRLPGFGKKWPDVVLGEVLTESRETGSSGKSARKITVKLYGLGVVPKTERLVGSENTQYYVRRAGQFIYSKLDFLNGAFGIIPPALDGYESTLDLPAFAVSPMVDARFLVEYMRRPVYYEAAVGLAHGGRKARRVNPAQLLETTVRMPPLDEQRAISDLLALSERELALLRQQLGALKEQKRGLLQQLLTGKRRLVAAAGEAPSRQRAAGKGA